MSPANGTAVQEPLLTPEELPPGSARPARPPVTLSPSRAADFKACPQRYKYRVLDRLPEPPDPSRARGTVVHDVLERLFRLPAEQRRPEVAQALLEEVWAACRTEEEYAGLEFAGEEERRWLAAAEAMLANAFAIEDPASVQIEEVEAPVAHDGERTALRGIIDRIERLEDGGWVLSDYKTGRSPSDHYALDAFFGLRFYALVCWRAFGQLPRELRLIQLGVPEILTLVPNPQMLEGLERQLDAIGAAILRARATGDWRPHPGPLCGRCSHRAICPAWSSAGS
jgi:putative RecB family exonuclease